MDSRITTILNNKPRDYLSFIFCALFFIAGSLTGTFYAMQISAAGSLPQFFSSLSSIIGASYTVEFSSVFITVLLFPLAAVFLAYSIFGFLLIPLLSAVKGFLVSFSVACAARFLGGGNLLAVCCMFAFTEIFCLPCYFVLASRSCVASLTLLRTSVGGGRLFTILYPFSPKTEFMIIVVILVTAAVYETYFKYPLLLLILRN